jgi:hypothetical protein
LQEKLKGLIDENDSLKSALSLKEDVVKTLEAKLLEIPSSPKVTSEESSPTEGKEG